MPLPKVGVVVTLFFLVVSIFKQLATIVFFKAGFPGLVQLWVQVLALLVALGK